MKRKQKTLVLGIGSPFGDDQFGWLVAEQIKEMLKSNQSSHIDIEIADRPGLNLLRFLEKNYTQVILIDAVNAGVEPGAQFFLQSREILEFNGFLSSHNIGVAPSLALADALNMPIDHVLFHGVQGQRLFVKDDLVSDAVKKSVSNMAQMITSQLIKS
ncbi:hydrogenase maturation protease [Cysteiniphilum sp. 6C5]|uniref:hydrogenase maturation protease n=1 Tax=unclassified Cysteiniphilum TaxID=2610889 RepID=UPI003F877883